MQARDFFANQMNRQGKVFAAVVGMVKSAFVAASSISIWPILDDLSNRMTSLPTLKRRAWALCAHRPAFIDAPVGVRTPCRSS